MNRKNKNEGSLAAVFFSQRHTINLEEGTNEKRATGELVASRKRMHKTEQKVNWFDHGGGLSPLLRHVSVRADFECLGLMSTVTGVHKTTFAFQ